MKKLTTVIDTIRDNQFTTKIQIFMSTKAGGDDYDPYEAKFTFTNLNPITIKGYVRQISIESLIYKEYGLHQVGAVEVICEAKYKNYFLNSNKIVINDVTYQVFKEGVGNRVLIQERPYNLLRVILNRNG